MSSRRLKLGLTDYERRERDRVRRARNCGLAILIGIILIGLISATGVSPDY